MKITLKDTRFFDNGPFSGNVYVEKKDGKGFNILLVNCVESHYKTKLISATRLYFVVEGSGTFIIDEKIETAHESDLFIITDNQVYSYKGKMKLIEINVPATDSSNEEKV